MTVLTANEGFKAPSTSDFWLPLFGRTDAFAITRPAVIMMLSVLVLAVWLLISTRKMTIIPGKGQYFVEQTYLLVRNTIAREIIGSREFLRFVPMLFTMFVLILLNNLFGITPFVQYPTMSRIAFPMALALIVFASYHLVGIKRMGIKGYFAHMVPGELPFWVKCILFPLELITYFFTRPVTLMFRLFGNMFAGHLILTLFIIGGEYMVLKSGAPLLVSAGILSWAMAFIMTLFELLVEFLQAYIFVLLTAMYVAGSVANEH